MDIENLTTDTLYLITNGNTSFNVSPSEAQEEISQRENRTQDHTDNDYTDSRFFE